MEQKKIIRNVKIDNEFLTARGKLLPCQKERVHEMWVFGYSMIRLAVIFKVSRIAIWYILTDKSYVGIKRKKTKARIARKKELDAMRRQLIEKHIFFLSPHEDLRPLKTGPATKLKIDYSDPRYEDIPTFCKSKYASRSFKERSMKPKK